MGADEEGTLAQLKVHRNELVDRKIREHRGRIVKTTGDGMLIEFASAVDAARCAVEIQRGMVERNAAIARDRRIEFRIGINVGDVIFDSEDIFGDGVNIAARLESMAQPNGIIISEDAYRQVRDKLDISFEDGGTQQLKNIARPVGVYRVQLDRPSQLVSTLTIPNKPSIAVLPFQNMSGDPEQEYFADGIVEDIITALSRFRQLFVIARNSSFVYKGRAADVKQVGRELGVRYVLEGSVRKASNRIRITGQLVDATTGAHLWADRFEGGLADVFDLQDQVTSSVVGAVAPKIEQAEIERAKSKPPESLQAYDHYLRGIASFYLASRESVQNALRHFLKASSLDPQFAPAFGWAAWCYVSFKAHGWMPIPPNPAEQQEIRRLCDRAVEIGYDDETALCRAGYAVLYVLGDHEGGDFYIERSLALNENFGTAWAASGFNKVWLGEHQSAIDRCTRAIRLSPFDPQLYLRYLGICYAHFFLEHYDEAASWGERAYRLRPRFGPILRITAAAYAMSGDLAKARAYGARAIEADPVFSTLSRIKDFYPFRRPQDLTKFEEALRLAGLPE
jgi:adenylate cyclase